ncbi:MAG: hypothetical protein QJR10_14415 [Bacillota bacterium]|nr:hypothetical protein [Bacillota bacterium]
MLYNSHFGVMLLNPMRSSVLFAIVPKMQDAFRRRSKATHKWRPAHSYQGTLPLVLTMIPYLGLRWPYGPEVATDS